jgi:hypothetical protein
MSKWQIPPPAPNDVYLRRLRELEPEADKRIKNQHVVSKVVLKGFAAPSSHGAGLQLIPFDLRRGHEQKPRGLAGCGKVPDFLTFASASAEQLWKIVEDQLHDAIAAARSGCLHNNEALTEAIKDCIALHLVRSIRYLQIHSSVIAKNTKDVRRRAVQSYEPMLRAEFRRRYGLEAAGPEALDIVLNDPISRWQALDARGGVVWADPGRARCVPDRTVSNGDSRVLTVIREHALTWAPAGQSAVRRSLPSWS